MKKAYLHLSAMCLPFVSRVCMLMVFLFLSGAEILAQEELPFPAIQFTKGDTRIYRYESSGGKTAGDDKALKNLYPCLYQNMIYEFSLTIKEIGDTSAIVTLRPGICSWNCKYPSSHKWKSDLRNAVYDICREKGVDFIMSEKGEILGVANFNELKAPIIDVYARFIPSLDKMYSGWTELEVGKLSRERLDEMFDDKDMTGLFPGMMFFNAKNNTDAWRWLVKEALQVKFEKTVVDDNTTEYAMEGAYIDNDDAGFDCDDYAYWMLKNGITVGDYPELDGTSERILIDNDGWIRSVCDIKNSFGSIDIEEIDFINDNYKDMLKGKVSAYTKKLVDITDSVK